MRSVETVIVGGGPAGSSCARELTKAGKECLILERQELPKFKLCAGWITPKVVSDLEIDLSSYPFGMVELRKIRINFGLSRRGFTVSTRQYSIRRIQFDNWLLERSGAEIAHHSVRSISRDGDFYVIDGRFKCRYLVGAGGTNCPVKRTFFGEDKGRLILTQEIEYGIEPKNSVCSLFYPFAGFAGYGWYVPKAGGVNIGYGGVAAQFTKNVKSYWDGFVKILIERGILEFPPPVPSSHPYYLGDRRKNVRRGNSFITGDAAGLASVDMGEGIGPAIESGLLAAREILGRDTYSLEKISKYSLAGLLRVR